MQRVPAGDEVSSLISSKALAGKRALVTGARKGIGRGVALCPKRDSNGRKFNPVGGARQGYTARRGTAGSRKD